ncbi:hypothetical protein ACTHQ6_10325 [Arthrobacter sp. SAFR-179]|uniref:hypothetical protein n=1 Tax=Arthrobacter sp. SAFR-179 TaxID=3387279 RepID=UPI003F7CD0AC
MTLTKIRTAAAGSLAAAGLLIALAGCSTPANQPSASDSPASASASASSSSSSGECAGVKVIVDSGALKQAAASTSTCVSVDGPTVASKVLDEAKIKTEGTTQYPDAVCRVNGVPAADFDVKHKDGTYREECKGMPAASAYWSIWIKPESGNWEYAQEALSTQKVKPGESLELLFTVDGEPAAPAA